MFEGDKQTLDAQGDHRRDRLVAAQRARASRSITRASSPATKRSTCTRCRSRWSIMGSGAVGVEFASIFRRFGSEVTIIELLPRLVPVEDEAVSAELEKSFRKQGITVADRHEGDEGDGDADGVDDRGADAPTARPQTISADISARRDRPRPVTTGLGVEAARPRAGAGYIKVDELYRTSVPDISAVGDVITLGSRSHPQLAHVSSAEGHHRRRADCRPGRAAAQLRPRARLHLLRSRRSAASA